MCMCRGEREGVGKKSESTRVYAAPCALATTTLVAEHAWLFVYPPYDVRASRGEQRAVAADAADRPRGWQEQPQPVPSQPSALTRRTGE